MSHDTHQTQTDSRPGSSFTSSIWFLLLLAGLFIAAVNFVEIMSHDDEGHGGHATEHAAPAHHEADAGHDAEGHEAAAHDEAHH